jgi:hypothetical protein
MAGKRSALKQFVEWLSEPTPIKEVTVTSAGSGYPLTRAAIAEMPYPAAYMPNAVGPDPESKDVQRIKDMITKTNGDRNRMRMFATNMSRAIKDPDKRKRRARAAVQVLTKLGDKVFGEELFDIFING